MRFLELLWKSALNALAKTVLVTCGFLVVAVLLFGNPGVELIAFAATFFTLATLLNLRRLC